MLDLKRCPVCHNNTSASQTTCPYCGHSFTATDENAAPVKPRGEQRRCNKCGTMVTGAWEICPVCKAPLDEGRGIRTYLVIAGFVVAVVLLAVFVFHIPGNPPSVPVSLPGPGLTPSPTPPACTIAITGQKTAASSILLRVSASSCSLQDVKELNIFINDQPAGTLPHQLGVGGSFPGHKGTDHVVVTATFSSGYQRTILDTIYA